jgi:hypothetical protein
MSSASASLPQARAIVLVPTTDRHGNVVFQDRLVSVHGYGSVPPGLAGAGAGGSAYSSLDDDDEVGAR